MLKFAGALIVIGCTGFMGMVKAGEYAKRPRELRALQAALQMLETEIIYGATPLPEALEYIAGRAEKSIAPLFTGAAEELSSRSGCTVQEAWTKAVHNFAPVSTLRENELEILRQLGSCLGMSDRSDQTKHLQLAMEQVKLETAHAKEQAQTRVKLWNYVGFLAGLLLVIILY